VEKIICPDCGKDMGKKEKDWRSVLVDLVSKTPELREEKWDAKKSIIWMKNSNFSNWNQDEWAGYFFEFITLRQKGNYLGMSPFKYKPNGCNMQFDWVIADCPADLKASSIKYNKKMSTMENSILNDAVAIEKAVKDYGKLYYIILYGSREVEKERELKNWKEKVLSKKISNYVSVGAERKHRKLKIWFAPKRIILCEINKFNLDYLSAFKQGNNSNKWTSKKNTIAKRNPKYQFYKKQFSKFIIAEIDLEPFQLFNKGKKVK